MVPAGRSILVVDDDCHVGRVLSILLAQEGLTVHVASSGQAAVEIYKRRRDSICGVLLDVQMPDLDGPSTLLALRSLDPSLPCCFMTGKLDAHSLEELKTYDPRAIFAKPLPKPEELIDSLKAAFPLLT